MNKKYEICYEALRTSKPDERGAEGAAAENHKKRQAHQANNEQCSTNSPLLLQSLCYGSIILNFELQTWFPFLICCHFMISHPIIYIYIWISANWIIIVFFEVYCKFALRKCVLGSQFQRQPSVMIISIRESDGVIFLSEVTYTSG